VVAVVLESAAAAAAAGRRALAVLAGWGRAGDAHHVCRPVPDGNGLARAARSALARAGLGQASIGYVNANGTGSPLGDLSEARALRSVFAGDADCGDGVPAVGATKSVHGHALEASALLELAVTVAALDTPDGAGSPLPATAGWLGEDCGVRPVLPDDPPAAGPPRHAMTLNSAFGGANTALVVTTP
jgi:3-oxoacyl-[acyl-carrier-protein] synthase II